MLNEKVRKLTEVDKDGLFFLGGVKIALNTGKINYDYLSDVQATIYLRV